MLGCGALICATASPALGQPGDGTQAEASELPASITAKEEDNEDTGSARGDDDERSETPGTESGETPAEENAGAAEVFVPSEAISEDLAVPFPVDI